MRLTNFYFWLEVYTLCRKISIIIFNSADIENTDVRSREIKNLRAR